MEKRLIIIEDNRIIARGIERSLSMGDIIDEKQIIYSIEEYYKFYENYNGDTYDFIILDLGLNKSSEINEGLDILKDLQKRKINADKVVYSAHEYLKEKCIELGADNFVHKKSVNITNDLKEVRGDFKEHIKIIDEYDLKKYTTLPPFNADNKINFSITINENLYSISVSKDLEQLVKEKYIDFSFPWRCSLLFDLCFSHPEDEYEEEIEEWWHYPKEKRSFMYSRKKIEFAPKDDNDYWQILIPQQENPCFFNLDSKFDHFDVKLKDYTHNLYKKGSNSNTIRFFKDIHIYLSIQYVYASLKKKRIFNIKHVLKEIKYINSKESQWREYALNLFYEIEATRKRSVELEKIFTTKHDLLKEMPIPRDVFYCKMIDKEEPVGDDEKIKHLATAYNILSETEKSSFTLELSQQFLENNGLAEFACFKIILLDDRYNGKQFYRQIIPVSNKQFELKVFNI